nr:hypothetical protein [Actinomycetota bacterium]
MATTTTRARPPRRKRGKNGRTPAGERGRGARWSSTGARRKAAGPGRASVLLAGMRRADVWGALLLVAGVLAALGTYAGLTGPWG